MAITDIFKAVGEACGLAKEVIDPEEQLKRHIVKDEKNEDKLQDKALYQAMSYFELCDTDIDQANKHRRKFKKYIKLIASS